MWSLFSLPSGAVSLLTLALPPSRQRGSLPRAAAQGNPTMHEVYIERRKLDGKGKKLKLFARKTNKQKKTINKQQRFFYFFFDLFFVLTFLFSLSLSLSFLPSCSLSRSTSYSSTFFFRKQKQKEALSSFNPHREGPPGGLGSVKPRPPFQACLPQPPLHGLDSAVADLLDRRGQRARLLELRVHQGHQGFRFERLDQFDEVFLAHDQRVSREALRDGGGHDDVDAIAAVDRRRRGRRRRFGVDDALERSLSPVAVRLVVDPERLRLSSIRRRGRTDLFDHEAVLSRRPGRADERPGRRRHPELPTGGDDAFADRKRRHVLEPAPAHDGLRSGRTHDGDRLVGQGAERRGVRVVGKGLRDEDGVGPRADGREVLLREPLLLALVDPRGPEGEGVDEPGVDEDGGS